MTKESPIPDDWKKKLLTIKKGEVSLHRFSPTGFYSSAVRNDFLKELEQRSARQTPFEKMRTNEYEEKIEIGPRGKPIFVKKEDKSRIEKWMNKGFLKPLKTPDNTFDLGNNSESKANFKGPNKLYGVFVTMSFSNWSQGETGNNGKKPDRGLLYPKL